MRAGRGLASCLGGLVLTVCAIGTVAAQPARKGDRELGEYLANQCTTCHQISGKTVGGIPPIVGWPEDQFIAIIESYKEGVRENETMRTISHRFSVEEIEALATYFGSIKPVAQ